MKTTITLRLDECLAREARALAARQGLSLNQMILRQLEEVVNPERTYETAKQRALARLRRGLEIGWTPPRSREEHHET